MRGSIVEAFEKIGFKNLSVIEEYVGKSVDKFDVDELAKLKAFYLVKREETERRERLSRQTEQNFDKMIDDKINKIIKQVEGQCDRD